ncbi:CsbD family protein [Belnapia sp. T18]|uniref:CsbD family protein n=1 Tax=Belnapia arida TaxID=2804533 RepID=A0ABS1UA36_9PROT|nr:CsbD family protein [Belnapia arida]MBL6081548.1 CsbD family protein [Belnapia arida]
MNSDNLEGAARGVAGKAQEVFGEVTGSGSQRAEGVARQVAGQAQEVYGDVRKGAEAAASQVGHVVKQQPAIALLVAGVIGYALGVLTASSLGGHSRRHWW